MNQKAKLEYDDTTYEMPIVEGTYAERGVDIRSLRKDTGLITLDSGYMNTGATTSQITYISGEEGILLYRGYPIEQLAEKSSFVETSYLLIYGELPTTTQLEEFSDLLTYHSMLHEDMRHFFDGFPSNAHPMAILSSMVSALSAYYPDSIEPDSHNITHIARLLSKLRTIAAFSYQKRQGRPVAYPKNSLDYCGNFLHMLFSHPAEPWYVPDPELVKALNVLLILHADHEQNCSTSTVRLVGSSQANLYAAISAGVSALWGPLHGGANQAVIEMLREIRDEGGDCNAFMEHVKNRERRLMGFGHRVYKNFDPRATILKKSRTTCCSHLGIDDPARHRAAARGDGALRRVLHRAQALPERRLLQRHHLPRDGHPHRDVHGAFRSRPDPRLDRPLERDDGRPGRPHRTSAPNLHGRHQDATTNPERSRRPTPP